MKKKRLPLAMLAALSQKPESEEILIYPIKWLDENDGTEVLDYNLYLSPEDMWTPAPTAAPHATA